MSIQKFSTKDPQETLLYTFDFSLVIPNATEAISSVAWSIVVSCGVDPDPSTMVMVGTEIIANKLCSIYVQGGLNDVEYILSCIATTSIGPQEVKLSGLLPVRTFQ